MSYLQGPILVLLIVIYPALIPASLDEESQPTYLTARVGEAVTFNCQLDFPQDIVIPYELHWRKEGQLVFSGGPDGNLVASEPFKGRVRQLTHPYGLAAVNLTSIRESDAGWYECRPFFPNRTPTSRSNGTWFHLTVDGDHLIATPPINQTIMEGDAAHFPCVTKDRASSVTWFKDDIPLIDMHELLIRVVVTPDGSLTISPTKMGDLGEYTCHVVGKDGDVQRTAAFLNVQYRAKVVYAPKEVYMPIGRPSLLDCHFRANPPLLNLRWEKDGFLFDPYNVKGVYFRSNGSLYFNKVGEHHGGNYTCTPFNELGTEGPSPVMAVIVQHPPIFSITPHNLYLKRKGDSVDMPCDAWSGNSKHKPSILWFKKDGSPLPPGRTTLIGSNLTIVEIEEDDRGVYQCVASNEAGSLTVETELMVENVAPRAPYDVVAEATVNSLTVSWASGLSAPKMADSVWYRAADLSVWKSMPAGDSHEVVIDNLLSGTDYEIMVLSKDPHGDGMFSKSIFTRTLGVPDIPIQQNLTDLSHFTAPTNLGIIMEHGGYRLSWTSPENFDENGNHYRVTWTKGGKPKGSVETTHSNCTLSVDSFDEDDIYAFQVEAVASDGTVIPSEKLLLKIPSMRSVRALSVTLGLTLLLIVLVAGGWYIRRHIGRIT